MAKSQLSISSQPPPSAKPFTAAMTGMGSVSMRRKSCDPLTEKRSASAGLMLGIFEISARSEEHTSELQSRGHLVCRLLLEKKKKQRKKDKVTVKYREESYIVE